MWKPTVSKFCALPLTPFPRCVPMPDACGGCPLQRMPYAAQLRAREELLRQTLRRIGGLDGSLVAAPLASPLTRGFRNKMEFAFGTDAGGRLLLGAASPQRTRRCARAGVRADAVRRAPAGGTD